MLIPERLEEKLAEDKSLRPSVDAAVADFGPWLRESKLPFFPDYTDHGTGHVEGVLVTASSLIGDEAWEGVTAADVAVLILAALLHDCAMHLTEEGFHALVSGSTHTKRVPGFGDVDWPELWQEFLFSAKRFDDRALTDLFGKPIAVRTPPTDKGEMTLNDRLLIGEFVRRHHPRLAHEIALRGVPGPTDNPIRLSERLDPKLADIAGLVARSHGLPLRATFDYLGRYYHRREYKGVHAVFLMAVLRVADYLQIQAERAPKQMLQVKDIRSPFSRREWRAHHSVDNIVPYEDDPEAILVQATPPDVLTFLRLKDWLAGIQEELDTSWAVLGEVYGPAEKLRRLGLVIRRVRSNLDDDRAFAQFVDYVPRRVEFDIARSEILKLLIRPLYGDKPEVGIRELLQNSVDAVRELWDLQEQNPALRGADLIEQEADVVMWLDEPDEQGRAAFTISDRGVGMTEEVITDYFLKVGASYRHSDTWARQHERIDEEVETRPDSAAGRPAAAEAGSLGAEEPAAPLRSRVLRSGRFGIGALAAFLLGDEIEVSTRHVNADKGIRFTTRLESEAIELRHVDALKVGTTVRVRLSPAYYVELLGTSTGLSVMGYQELPESQKELADWDWYCLSEPSVLRQLGHGRTALPQKHSLPNLGEDLPPGWFEVKVPGYRAVHCFLRGEPGLVCNGIEIRDTNEDVGFRIAEEETGRSFAPAAIKVNRPLVSIFDPDGNLPLNLTRSGLTGEDNFVKEISEARLRYFLAYLIVHAPIDYQSLGGQGLELLSQSIRSYPVWPLCPLFHTAAGASLAEPWNVFNTKIKTALVISPGASSFNSLSLDRDSYDATFLLNSKLLQRSPFVMSWAREALIKGAGAASALLQGFNLLLGRGPFHDKSLTSARVLTTAEVGRVLKERGSRASSLRAPLIEEWSDGQWMLLSVNSPPPTSINLESLPNINPKSLSKPVSWASDSGNQLYAAEWFLERRAADDIVVKPTKLASLWEEIVREPVIPYDPKERRRKLAHAYEILAPYIEKIEADARAGAAAKKGRPRGGGGSRKKG